MPEDAPHKSHAWHWIISVVVALVLYVGSAYPVTYCVLKHSHGHLTTAEMKATEAFYKPVFLLLNLPPLMPWHLKWSQYWRKVIFPSGIH